MPKQLIAAVSIIGIAATTTSCRSSAPAVNTPQPAAAPAPLLPDGGSTRAPFGTNPMYGSWQ